MSSQVVINEEKVPTLLNETHQTLLQFIIDRIQQIGYVKYGKNVYKKINNENQNEYKYVTTIDNLVRHILPKFDRQGKELTKENK
jgi:hypothetical protein